MTDRAQFTTPRWMPVVAVSIGVVLVVADAVLEAQREAMTQCAPDCQGGAPLFAHVGLVDAALVAIPLLGIGFLSWVLFRSGVMPGRIGGERDE
jgi:hypothetical protein